MAPQVLIYHNPARMPTAEGCFPHSLSFWVFLFYFIDIDVIIVVNTTMIMILPKKKERKKSKFKGKSKQVKYRMLVIDSLAIKYLWSHLCVKTTNKQKDIMEMACIFAIPSLLG